MKKIPTEEIDLRSFFYFYSPRLDHARYALDYRQKYNEQHIIKYGIRYSPLYLLREDIMYCLGKTRAGKNNMHNLTFGPAIFASLLLLSIGIDILRKVLGISHPDFLSRYMVINNQDLVQALADLANGVKHNKYSLYHRNKTTKILSFFILGAIDSGDVIQEDQSWKKSESKRYIIDPFSLYKSFEKAVEYVQEEISKDPGKHYRFMEQSKLKYWISLF